MKKLFIALVLLSSFGCAPKEEPVEQAAAPPQQSLEPEIEQPKPADKSPFIGTWIGKYESSGGGSAMSSKESSQMSGMLESYRATLELREDGTYRFTVMVGAQEVEDEWETNGDAIVLASSGIDQSSYSTSANGTPNKQEYWLEANADGTLTGQDPIQQGYGAMVFSKQ